MQLQEKMNRAFEQLKIGNLTDAESLFRDVLAERPTNADALHLLGCTVSKLGRPDEAAELIQRAVVLEPNQPVFQSNLSPSTLLALGKKREAVVPLRRALQLQPNSAQLLTLLGNTLSDLGEFEQAIQCLTLVAQNIPTEAGHHYNLGNVWYRKATSVSPEAQAPDLRIIELQNAIGCYKKTLELSPNFLDAGNNLGNVFRELGRMDEAIAIWRRTVAFGPHFFSYYNLGRALAERDLTDDARDAMESAIRINSKYPDAFNNLGNLFRQSGQAEKSIEQFDHALELDPDYAIAQSNRLYTIYYDPSFDAKRILKEHQKWNDAVARPSDLTIAPHDNDRTPDRPLKIGYVSPNFWGHCQALFTLPLFSNHDRQNFQTYCYSDVKSPDSTTARLRESVTAWRNIAGQSDDQVAELIRADQIDILVDLTLHMSENRIHLFSRKPAPIQVTWLGYPGTTGLETIDYRLTDPYLDPPGETDNDYSEKSIRLPHTFWCMDATALHSAEIPPVNPLPAKEAGHITFGCLNNFCKVNQPLLDLWKRVLDAVPNSRMIVLAPHGSPQKWVRQTLGNRVTFVPHTTRPEYLKYHHKIDISLDTLPYNGHTTTLDSLWMGIPVVTMIGQTVVGRAGLSMLTNVGLTDLVTTTPDEFVERAVQLSKDLSKLTDLRATLRDRMRSSPLMDAPRFANGIEAAFREMWKRYCVDT